MFRCSAPKVRFVTVATNVNVKEGAFELRSNIRSFNHTNKGAGHCNISQKGNTQLKENLISCVVNLTKD
jgi:hypothetical protein